jgi:hypothetical protein
LTGRVSLLLDRRKFPFSGGGAAPLLRAPGVARPEGGENAALVVPGGITPLLCQLRCRSCGSRRKPFPAAACIVEGGAEMIETTKPTEVELVKCEVCLREIPKSDAQNAEVRDYVAYFCGLECYEKWEEAEMKQRTQEAGEP